MRRLKIGIDGRALGGNVRDGISNVSCSLFRHMPQIKNVEFTVFTPHARLYPDIEGCRSYLSVGASGTRRGWFLAKLPRLLEQYPVDAFWSPMQTLPLGVPSRTRTAVTVHDFTFLKFPETMTFRCRLNLKVFGLRSLRKADVLLPISASTERDLRAVLGEKKKSIVIHNGVDHEKFFPGGDLVPDLAEKGLRKGRYFLVVGSLEPRKNLQTLIDGAEVFLGGLPSEERPRFVFVYGNSWRSEAVSERIERGILAPGDTVHLRGISDEALRSLYANAAGLVFPSVYEGFGLPAVEAMACGCPVIASDISVFREVCGGAARMASPKDPASFAYAMGEVWGNGGLRDVLRERGLRRALDFDWRKSAETLAEVLLTLAKSERERSGA
jgi:glycosyltransferase involved in cell wall biosynthesis